MNKTETYRQTLASLPDWEPYLLQESGLPGPRGNLELAQVVADEGDRALFEHFLAYTPQVAPTNDPHEFLAFCGVVGLGRLLAEGDEKILDQLRPFASDPRWRLREGVAMALQRLGKVTCAACWLPCRPGARATGSRNAPPRLPWPNRCYCTMKKMPWRPCKFWTGSPPPWKIPAKPKTNSSRFCSRGWVTAGAWWWRLRQQQGKRLMEKWLACPDRAIRRIMQENLKKNRLVRMDAAWVEKWRK